MPDCLEFALGQISYNSLIASWGGKNNNHECKGNIEKIAQDLFSQTERKGLTCNIAIVHSQTPNAACLPGGYMVISQGLINKINEYIDQNNCQDITKQDLIAAVLGHEIGHAEGRHSARSIEFMLLITFIFAIIKNYLFTRKTRHQDTKEWIYDDIKNVLSFFIKQKKSRCHEFEADRYGIELMHKTNIYQIDAAIHLQEMFKSMEHVHKNKTLKNAESIFRSHPFSEDRLQENRKTIEALRK
jgi:Zn-dependent protease with chaperone function